MLEGEKFERVTFKLKFEDWPTGKELSVYNVLEVKQAGNIKPKDKEWKVYDRGSDVRKVNEIDVVTMYDKNSAPENAIAKNTETLEMDPAELVKRDWGFSKLRIWKIHDMARPENAKIEITADHLAQMEISYSPHTPLTLSSDDCYVFQYEFKEKPAKMSDSVLVERSKITREELEATMKISEVMYIWIGNESSIPDQGITAHVAVEIQKTVATSKGSLAKGKHVRVLEGKEPTHFLSMIRGGSLHLDQPKKVQVLLPYHPNPPSPVVVYKRSGLKNIANNQSPLLFHVWGSTHETVRITQMSELSSEYICSGAVYVLLVNNAATIWHGVGSFTWEQEAAATFVDKVVKINSPSLSVKVVKEGQEGAEFWNPLGGQKTRSNDAFWKKRPTLPVDWPADGLSLGSTGSGDAKAPYDVRMWRINHFVNGNPTV